jgi:hypothetical protein
MARVIYKYKKKRYDKYIDSGKNFDGSITKLDYLLEIPSTSGYLFFKKTYQKDLLSFHIKLKLKNILITFHF